ncbi:MAG: hypothetical protein AAGA30_01030, partial [Planctomycetota bacterium]
MFILSLQIENRNQTVQVLLFYMMLIFVMGLFGQSTLNGQTDYVTKYDPKTEEIDDLVDLLLVPQDLSLHAAESPHDTNSKTKPLEAVTENLSDESLSQETIKIRELVQKNDINFNKASKPVPILTVQQQLRKTNIARCLAMYYQMPVDTENWRPWTIMHGLLPYGQQSRVIHRGNVYSAVDYLCHNAIGNDKYLMYLDGRDLEVAVGPGVQGHEGQFLAMLAQSNVPIDQQIIVGGRTFTIHDLIEYEQRGCRQRTELTFKLIGLSHYLKPHEIWKSSDGKSWNIERLIYEEIAQPING